MPLSALLEPRPPREPLPLIASGARPGEEPLSPHVQADAKLTLAGWRLTRTDAAGAVRLAGDGAAVPLAVGSKDPAQFIPLEQLAPIFRWRV